MQAMMAKATGTVPGRFQERKSGSHLQDNGRVGCLGISARKKERYLQLVRDWRKSSYEIPHSLQG